MPKIERIKNRHFLKKKKQKHELQEIENQLGCPITLPEAVRLESGNLTNGSKVLLLKNRIFFFEKDNKILPTLHALLEGVVELPKVTVDMGAVKFVANGADIMRPGITQIDDDVVQGTIVAIVDETHGKPLAVGISLLSSNDMRNIKSGKVIRSLHHVGDALWNFRQ